MPHLSEGSSSNHLQDLKVLLVQPHLLHFGGERFDCRQKEERSIRRQLKPSPSPHLEGDAEGLSRAGSALQAIDGSHPG